MQEHHHFNYLIKKVRRLGNGGFGYVDEVELYNANGIKCSGKYARKTFYPSSEFRDTIVNIGQFKERFRQEVKCQASCTSSYVVPIYLHNLHIESPWFIMDLAESDLSKLIDENSLDTKQKISIVKMILKGFDYIHNKEFLHRDIKPQNILKFRDGTFKISDFGLVKDLNRGDNPLTTIVKELHMGTREYMAPEIINAVQYSKLSDVYALGVLIEKLAIPGSEYLTNKCTARIPSSRYQSMQEVLYDLNNLYQGG